MSYLKGEIGILSDIANLKKRGYYYWAALDNIPSDVWDMQPVKIPATYLTEGIVCAYTTKVPGRVAGRHCVFAFPKSVGKLQHIYCGDLNVDLLDVPEQEETWASFDIMVKDIPYEIWYQKNKTKDVNLAYRFTFYVGGHE